MSGDIHRRPERPHWHHASDSPASGQTALTDDNETTVFDVGTDGGPTSYRLDDLHLDVALGGHSEIDVYVKVDVNGTLTQVGTVNLNEDKTLDLADIGQELVASPHVRVTATGDTLNPASDGTVDRTVVFSEAN
jgi:hypothetical protein